MRWRPCSSMMIAISISFSTRSECIYSMEMLEQLNVEFSISLLSVASLLLDYARQGYRLLHSHMTICTMFAMQ
ncbi:hypothetical protein L2E82_26671 [Cichorium intybus]|uniref:Uncharacterized protein n=1 Tax=Cichorium intybus TaxID=13427 RepID=A0ACB9CRA8_CICIN|nr:hypothetical protein L2E82_26671 [Cichorium intybus]